VAVQLRSLTVRGDISVKRKPPVLDVSIHMAKTAIVQDKVFTGRPRKGGCGPRGQDNAGCHVRQTKDERSKNKRG
jgi:hypothetical protein